MTPFGEQIVLHRRPVTGQDVYGNDVQQDVDDPVTALAFDPGGSVETVQGGDRVVTQPTLYLPDSVVVDATHAATVRGVRYEVDGTPARWRSPWTGRKPGIVVRLRGVTG